MLVNILRQRKIFCSVGTSVLRTVVASKFSHPASSLSSYRPAHDGDLLRIVDSDADTGGSQATPNLVQNLRVANSSYELFEIVSLKRKEFGSEHVMLALKRLFHLQKNETTAIPNKHILKNPDFEHLCRNLKHVARTLDVNDTIEAMKILNYVGVPTNSDISMTLLHLVRQQINDISLGQIVFLEFLMKKFDPTPLVEAFRIALPMLMQIQLGTRMDHENAGQLTDLLQFATRNPMSEQACMNIVSALTLHGTDLSLDEARSCVWSLTELRTFTETHERLLHNCLEVMCDSLRRMSFDMVETTLSKMVVKYAVHRVDAFYDEEFFGRCAQYVIDKDVGFLNAIYVQRKFNRINYVSVELIEYMTEKCCARPELLSEAQPTPLLTFVTALATPHYVPVAWETLQPYVMANALVRESPRATVPMTRFAMELAVLGAVDEELLSQLNEPTYVKQQMQRHCVHPLDMLQFLQLHQVTELLLPPTYAGHRLSAQLIEKAAHIQFQKQEMPLRATVARVFGQTDTGAAVYSSVVTRYGHFVDHVVLFDANGQVAVRTVPAERTSNTDADDEDNIRFEDIRTNAGERAVAIVTFPRSHYCLNLVRLKGLFQLRVRTLERLGMPVCVINADVWSRLPEHEKMPYVEREVREKLSEFHV